MTVHPPIKSRPRALWEQSQHPTQAPWRQHYEETALAHFQEALCGTPKPLSPHYLGLLGSRPDWARRIGPGGLEHPQLRSTLFAHPAAALSLLCSHYESTAPRLERALQGSGESVFHLLHWASRNHRTLHQPDSFYRTTLLTDTYWALRQAHSTGDAGLLAEAATWCGDERKHHSAAAAYFLLQHPRESVSNLREVVNSNPFYTYVSYPRLASRGLSVTPAEVAGQPKWACHFALSRMHPRPDDFISGVKGDPGWIIELASGRGWLESPPLRREVERMLIECPDSHPLREPALHFIRETVFSSPAPAPKPNRPVHQAIEPLTSGLAAEVRALGALKIAKNTEVWRPSRDQVDTPAFRQIVGPPRFTGLGRIRGTVLDSVEDGFAEIKSGKSVLNSTYQLRLQTYRALMEDQPFKIYTNRPVDSQFAQWLTPWGVKIEPLPGP